MIDTLKKKMESYYGLREIPGEQDNPTILYFFHNIGHAWVQSDETGWCSAALNSCAKDIGLEYSGRLDARSWLEVGEEYTPPADGADFDDNVIVIFWREDPNGWKGHVGVPVRMVRKEGIIWTLGGNQSDMMQTSPYSIAGSNHGLLEFRKLNPVS